jgi:hemerythrin-like domain-containing protein
MMADIKPIKRSEQLAPLSREHHEGLLFAWKIRKGLQYGADPERIRKFMLWYWQRHIKPHFYQEEKILLPYLPAGHEMATRLKKEHDHIRELILSLDKEADKNTFIVLANFISDHIRFEERELYGYLEQVLGKDELDVIFLKLEEHPVHFAEWKDEFWVKK